MIFVGLKRGAKAARLWDPDTHCILVSGDVQYQEETFPSKVNCVSTSGKPPPTTTGIIFPSFYNNTDPDPAVQPPPPPPSPTIPNTNGHGTMHTCQEATPPNAVSTVTADKTSTPAAPIIDEPRQSGRLREEPVRYGFSATDISLAEHDHPSYSQAMKGPEKDAWHQACR